ncbi:beta galactosidase jelly roll domain-containing protein [Luteolibacter yonseiensis]|uniref:Beta-galactosidase n=1 Tax=Luteolibacter yonseiensis TaxID=1144680 RepID=A0A934QYC9_9BACT|nr:glycoside hydrolase family 2 TIM barrel-domain containing protein [Luteolibacter yonseiensis]MBK1814953.1 beta galactosidase jelly roll domain-containing protein [Luteolibacter yonseiensis]
MFSNIRAAPISVYPAYADGFTELLNGDWSFKYIPGLDAGTDEKFHEPGFDTSGWKKIPVPSNWELKGFSEPKYALELEDGLGLYRRLIKIPEHWRGGRRVCLRFEGVAYGFAVWVNGKNVGASSASAYNPHTFDITDALAGENMIAVRVTTKPPGWAFDVNDDWALSGIFRDVTLFSVPENHVRDITTGTRLAADGAAEFSVSVKLSQPGDLSGKLFDPDGKLVSGFSMDHTSHHSYNSRIRVEPPRLWTAETPSLYHLQLTLSANGRPLQTIEERVGLREISISDGVLLLNSRPVKLRGVNHHDIGPESGRSVTEQEMRRDLGLMKKGNINFIRTSHYPPQPRLIELCDELGFYVMDEVSIGKGEEHLNDPEYRENILARVGPTITRDKNRASVIIWSIGNENPVTEVELEACRSAKEIDPTRPICIPKIGSYFASNYEKIPEYVDIYAPHYPGNGTLRGFAKKLKRPTILTEYAHALGLATDRIQDQWEILQANPVFAGGALWHFHDQGILRTSDKPVDRGESTDSVWLDDRRYYDTHANDGCDGLVYADRTPQTDFWEMRKVYAPVQIVERAAVVKPGAGEISLTIENRYDFRSLEGMKLAWFLSRNREEIQHGEVPLRAASHESENLRLPVAIPAGAAEDVLTLELRCLDEAGMQINERTVRLDFAGTNRIGWTTDSTKADSPKVSESKEEVKIESARWSLTIARPGGELAIRDRSGRVLVAGICPHPGRKLTMTEGRSAGRDNTWRYSTLKEITRSEIKVIQEGSAVRLSVAGTYPRPRVKEEKEVKRSDEPLDQLDKSVGRQDVGGEAFVGGYQLEITPGGVITVHYDYVPTNAKGRFSEAGLSVVLPADLTEFRWIGQGPYAGYPGKDRLNEFGLFHLNREDLRYQGNRRETECALVTTPQGKGVALATSPADVAIERDGGKTLLSHNSVMSGFGNKGSGPETSVNAAETPRVSGSFTLMILEESWPEMLTRWFGKPVATDEIFRPFHHSYDQ